MGELLIAWSARVVVAFYLLRLAADVLIVDPVRRDRWARWAWTLGCAVYLVHVAFAFQFLHHWSHAAAVEHAAHRTFEVVGIRVWRRASTSTMLSRCCGWLTSLLWWRRSLAGRPTRRLLLGVQAIFAFMMFNATVVFGPAFWKWVAAGALVVIVALRMLLPRTPRSADSRIVIGRFLWKSSTLTRIAAYRSMSRSKKSAR